MGAMTTEQEAEAEAEAAEPRATPDPTGASGPVALIILAILCGAGALVLTVFGVWPGALLIVAAVVFGALAKRRLRHLPST